MPLNVETVSKYCSSSLFKVHFTIEGVIYLLELVLVLFFCLGVYFLIILNLVFEKFAFLCNDL